MSAANHKMRQEEVPNVPTLGASMHQGTTGTNNAKANAPDLTSSMHQGKRKGATGVYEQKLGSTMKQSGGKRK